MHRHISDLVGMYCSPGDVIVSTERARRPVRTKAWDEEITTAPAALARIQRDTEALAFSIASEPRTGSLLRALAASKPAGRFLELGTGTGVGTCWILSGMDAQSTIESVDSDPSVLEVAARHLGGDRRVTFHQTDGVAFLGFQTPRSFDFIYADSWPGKFSHLDLALSLLRDGGIYFVDDLLPQPNWPDGHASKVSALIAELERRPGFVAVRLGWSSGLMMLVRTSAN